MLMSRRLRRQKNPGSSTEENKETPASDPKSTATPPSTDTPTVDSGKPPPKTNDGFRIVRSDGAPDALLVNGEMFTEKKLKAILKGPLPRREHRKRRKRREGSHETDDSRSSDDSNGTEDESRSPGRSSRSSRSRRSRRTRGTDSGH